MSQVKAKQLKLNNQGDLLIGGVGGNGSVLGIGDSGQVLRVVDSAPQWSVNNTLISSDGQTSITATDTSVDIVSDGFSVAKFGATPTADSNLIVTSDSGSITLSAEGSQENVDLILAAKGTGDVVIGSTGSGVIQADDGYDLKLMGGEGAGNLLLAGGGTGKVYYGDDALDPLKEVATKGDIDSAIAQIPETGEVQFAGDATFVLPQEANLSKLDVLINGLLVTADFYLVDSETKVLTFSNLPYGLDNLDKVVVKYEAVAA